MDLDYELYEAQLEIDRHHEDFERIRAILDEWENLEKSVSILHRPVNAPIESLKKIRNIVG